MSAGLFITFEGGEGSGKSTQMRLLADRLRSAGVMTRCVREPGGTIVGEAVREIVLNPAHEGLDRQAELMLYEAARAQHTAHVIRPALAEGEIVLCDRYFDSSTAYQGYARGIPLDEVRALNIAATGGLLPDRTLLLDIEPTEGVTRATHSGADRLEGEDEPFHRRVRNGYLEIAAAEPDRFRVIDASGTVDEVAVRVAAALSDLPRFADALR